ncbi:MAG: Tad domain-containing protein [Planctomycetota bacterium]
MVTKKSLRGQVMVVSLAFLLPAAILVAFLHNHGLLLQHRQRLQVAADRAAVSGSLLECDLLSAIAWTNLALADVHAQGVLHCVNTATAGTLAEIEDWGRKQGIIVDPPSVVGGLGAVERYQEIYNTASAELPNIVRWETRLLQMQHNLAALGKQLIQREVYRTALANLGVEGEESVDGMVHVAMFPFNRQWAPSALQEESWHVSYDGFSNWSLENTQGALWNVTATQDGTYNSLSYTDANGDVTQSFRVERFPNNVKIDIDTPMGWGHWNLIWDPSRSLWSTGDLDELAFGHGSHGGIFIQYKGSSGEYLRDSQTGQMMQWSGSSWIPLKDTFEFNGVEIPADMGAIKLIKSPLDFLTIHIENNGDLWFDMGGGMQCHFGRGDSKLWFRGQVSPLTSIVFREGSNLRINDLQVPQDATGLWQMRHNLRERLSQMDQTHFVYDIGSMGSMLRWDRNVNRFGVDQSQDLFGAYFGAEGVDNSTWIHDTRNDVDGYRRTTEGWYMPIGFPASTPLDDDNHFHRTVTCWHPYDIDCPSIGHGPNCPGNGGGFTSVIDGGWHDPVTGMWVDCILCDKLDKDGDGDSDVRRYPESNLASAGSRLRQAGDPTNFTMPLQPNRLVLAEDYFKWGLNIAVHSREYPFDRFIMASLFPELEWSPVATASARSGFVDPETGRIRYRFDDPDDREEWVDENPWNLIVTDWVASLISTREALKLDDIEINDSFTQDYGWIPSDHDVPSVILLRHFLTDWLREDRGQWRRSWDDKNPSGTYAEAAYAKNPAGDSWDLNDMDLDSWIKH